MRDARPLVAHTATFAGFKDRPLVPEFLGLTIQPFSAMIYCEKFHLAIVSKDYNDVSFDSDPFF